MTEQFAPTVLLENGETFTPQNWMWVLAYAVRGIPWAMEEANKPWFDEAVRKWRRDKGREDILAEIAGHEAEITALRAKLEALDDDS